MSCGSRPAIRRCSARLDEEIEALDAAGLDWSIVPGITAASAAVATHRPEPDAARPQRLVRFLTGHDMRASPIRTGPRWSQPGAVAAIYMGKRAARWMQGRLLMHGAAAATPVTVVENASRPDQRIVAATLATLPDALSDVTGPAVLLLGLAPRAAATAARPPGDRAMSRA